MPGPRCDKRRWQAWLAAGLYLWALLLPTFLGPGAIAAHDPLAVQEICTGDGQISLIDADGLPVPAHGSEHRHCPGCLPGCAKMPAVLAVLLAEPAPSFLPRVTVRPEPSASARTHEARRNPPVRGPPPLV